MSQRFGYILPLLAVPHPAPGAPDKAGAIEFFGAKGFNLTTLRQQLPIQPGDSLQLDWKAAVRQAVLRNTGKESTDIAEVCCDVNGARTVFIGVQGQTYRAVTLGPAPQGNARLPAAITSLYEREEAALRAAIIHGHAGEDDSHGYAQSEDPDTRTLQQQLHQYALHHASSLAATVAQDSAARERQAATMILWHGCSLAQPGEVIEPCNR